MKNTVIIVAGGRGKRMGSSLPKQFLEINGKALILHTIEKFLSFDSAINLIVVVNPDYLDLWLSIVKGYPFAGVCKTVAGGETRFHSVRNGIVSIIDEDSIVGIHDAVRPLISRETIKNIYLQASIHGNAVPAIPVSESIRKITDEGSIMIERSALRIIQTPQVFRYNMLRKAYETEFKEQFTDDASVVEYSGVNINLVDGDVFNIKITTPEDLEIAKALL